MGHTQDLTPDRVVSEAIAPDRSASAARLGPRRTLRERLDHQRRALDAAAAIRTFDLAAEPASVRDAYGRNAVGQSCLLARRLAEAGVPMINVHDCRRPPGWDTHGRHFAAMTDSLCPTLETAFTALVDDLDRRGRLDSTLVWVNSEFGRTPGVNRAAGRDHWPWAYSLVLAGGGIAGGVCVGATDAIAAHPTRASHDPADLVATVYHVLGVPPATTIRDQLGRPHALVNGKPIDALLA